MQAFWIFVVGTVLALGALGYGPHLLGVQTQWIVIGVVLAGGIAIASGASLARRRNQTNVAVSADSSKAND